MSGRFLAPLACLAICLAAPEATAQFAPVKIRVKYICPKEGRSWRSSNGGEKHYCWDGKHYSQSTGGVPAFVLEYWEEEARKSAQFDEEMKRSREEARVRLAADEAAADAARRAAGLPSLAEARRAHDEKHRAAVERALARSGGSPASRSFPAGVATVAQSPKPTHQPLPLDRFNGLGEGMERGTVIEKLGQPHGAMSNLGSSGDEEALTYLVEGGGHGSIRLRQGKLVSVRLPKSPPAGAER